MVEFEAIRSKVAYQTTGHINNFCLEGQGITESMEYPYKIVSIHAQKSVGSNQNWRIGHHGLSRLSAPTFVISPHLILGCRGWELIWDKA
jgi:hypothetical protein